MGLLGREIACIVQLHAVLLAALLAGNLFHAGRLFNISAKPLTKASCIHEADGQSQQTSFARGAQRGGLWWQQCRQRECGIQNALHQGHW